MSVRKFLTEYNRAKGCGESDADLMEILTESPSVWKGNEEEHRWYILVDRVVQIGSKFIKFKDYVITGDNSMYDMGLEYCLDDVVFVERKERVITEVYYAPAS